MSDFDKAQFTAPYAPHVSDDPISPSGRAVWRIGKHMIESADIQNFRCFERLHVSDCRRVNVIVGDNGSGKTALLEAIFLALGGSPELGVRFRQQRGLDGNFAGSPRIVERAIFGDLFRNRDLGRPIDIRLNGQGPEARGLSVTRGTGPFFIIDPNVPGKFVTVDEPGASPSQGLNFTWYNSYGRPYSVPVAITPSSNLAFQSTGEDLDDFFYFTAHNHVSSLDIATRFSDMSKASDQRRFVDTFTRTFDFIEDLSIEVSGASPVIHAKIKNQLEKIPVANVSGAVNRLIGVLIALASTRGSVVLIDELENGIYYKHHQPMWRALLDFAREYHGQVFTTTHSEEWLEALVDAAGDRVDDVALWRMERGLDGPVLRQFSGRAFKAGLESGGEVR